jgi:hypothetical protein
MNIEQFDWLANFPTKEYREIADRRLSDFISDEFDDYYFVHSTVGIIDNFPFDTYLS